MPFVLDQRLPEDTLFWIMEEDFRFWPPQKDPDRADDYEEEYTILRAAGSSQKSSGSSLPPSLGAIWVSWVPKKTKRRSFIGHGSACILMTKAGMKCVRGAMERKVLRRALRKP